MTLAACVCVLLRAAPFDELCTVFDGLCTVSVQKTKQFPNGRKHTSIPVIRIRLTINSRDYRSGEERLTIADAHVGKTRKQLLRFVARSHWNCRLRAALLTARPRNRLPTAQSTASARASVSGRARASAGRPTTCPEARRLSAAECTWHAADRGRNVLELMHVLCTALSRASFRREHFTNGLFTCLPALTITRTRAVDASNPRLPAAFSRPQSCNSAISEQSACRFLIDF